MAEKPEFGSIVEALEWCARLVETSHTAHDLHEIAARIRGKKQTQCGLKELPGDDGESIG